MKENNKTKASAFPRRQANTPKFEKKERKRVRETEGGKVSRKKSRTLNILRTFSESSSPFFVASEFFVMNFSKVAR